MSATTLAAALWCSCTLGTLQLRHARPSDLGPLATLLAGPPVTAAPLAASPAAASAAAAAAAAVVFDWSERGPARGAAEEARWRRALPARLAPRADHLFAVIVDGSTGELVGCTELGLMRAPVGYATAAASAAAGDRVAYIGNVAVEPQRRRSGVGARLVGFACKWAQSQWARGDVFAHVEASNAPARALYAGLGFAEYAGSADAADASARAGVGRQVLLVRHAGASVAGSRE